MELTADTKYKINKQYVMLNKAKCLITYVISKLMVLRQLNCITE